MQQSHKCRFTNLETAESSLGRFFSGFLMLSTIFWIELVHRFDTLDGCTFHWDLTCCWMMSLSFGVILKLIIFELATRVSNLTMQLRFQVPLSRRVISCIKRGSSCPIGKGIAHDKCITNQYHSLHVGGRAGLHCLLICTRG